MLTPASPSPRVRIVGYCVLNPNLGNGEALDKLRSYCQEIGGESEVFAEEVDPAPSPGPLWLQVLSLIQNQECGEVAVPDLHHVASGNQLQMVRFFTLLKKTGVRFRTMDGVIDTSRQSIDEIASISVSTKAMGWL